MNRVHLAFSAALLAFTLTSSGVARADVAPPDSCTGAAGTKCNNAPPSYDIPGVCTDTTCQKFDPTDGGTIDYPCTLCVAVDGGSTSSSSSSSGGEGGSGSSGGSGGGCSVTMASGDGVIAGVMLALGLGALIADRRRRRG
jgi:MYXO-CTERM domain-containing protein